MIQYFLNFKDFIGRKSLFWLFIGFFSSMLLGFVDLFIAFFIQLFLVSLGFISDELVIMGIHFPKLHTSQIVLLLLSIGVVRFCSQLLANHSNSFVLDYTNLRLRILLIYDLLFKKTNSQLSVSEVNFKISELFPKSSGFISCIVTFCTIFIQCSSVFLFMLFTSWKESILALLGIIIIGLLVLKINKNVRKISNSVPGEQFKLNAGIEKVARNLLFISIMRTQNKEQKSLNESAINYTNFTIRVNFLNCLASTLSPFLGIILLVTIISLSQIWWHTSGLTLISFLYLLVRFIQNLTSLASMFGQMSIYYPQFKATNKYFQTYSSAIKNSLLKSISNMKIYGSSEFYKTDKLIVNNIEEVNKFLLNNNLQLENINYNQRVEPPVIEFKNVFYSYPKSDTEVVNNLSFKVLSGLQVGIIGPSGVGKSTILLLLLNLIKPKIGTIEFNGSEPESFFNNNVNKVGYVGPEPYLIQGSIRENICYGIARSINDEEIFAACEKASLKDLILSKGLDYEISEDHSGLSAGQKQRLCLARAFLNKPILLVLDEATANLDEKAESEIADTLYKIKNECTIFIVSHRPGILKFTDNIIKLG